MPEDVSRQVPEDVSRQVPEDVSRQVPEDVSKQVPGCAVRLTQQFDGLVDFVRCRP